MSLDALKKVTAIILAGGTSRRMGQDKATMHWQGKAFVEHIIEAAAPMVSGFLIVSDDETHEGFGHPRVPDLLPHSGPVSGIAAGLKASTTEWNLVLCCDVPFITTEVLHLLFVVDVNDYDTVHLRANGRDLPLIGLYRGSCTEPFERQLNQGKLRVMEALDQVRVKTVKVPEAFYPAVRNVNTREDLG